MLWFNRGKWEEWGVGGFAVGNMICGRLCVPVIKHVNGVPCFHMFYVALQIRIEVYRFKVTY
jgi:hypothetical protein